jgi:hypothetical protein
LRSAFFAELGIRRIFVLALGTQHSFLTFYLGENRIILLSGRVKPKRGKWEVLIFLRMMFLGVKLAF